MTRYAKTMRGALSALVAFALLAGGALPADARDATREARGERRSSPFNIMVSSTYSMSFNEWTCGLTQVGEVCSSAVGSSVGGGGFWPSGTANQYIFNSGLQIAGLVGPDGGTWAGDTIGRFFFNASGNGSGQPWPGNPGIYASNRPEDLAAWPEDCYIDNPVFGRVKTLSELDTCVQYWDGVPSAPGFSDAHPLGILVTQHSLLWSFPSNKDIMFFIYRFENVTNRSEFTTRNPQAPAGGYTITDLYAAFAADPDVAGGDYDDNFATVVPDLNLGVAWNTDFLDQTGGFVPYPPNFDAAIGFVGMKFLKSPVNTTDTTVTVRVGAETRTVAPGEELGLTFFSVFTNGGIMSDATNGKQAFRYLSGQLSQTERTQWCPVAPPGMCYVNLQEADDMRFYQSSGPFELAPGEAAEIVVAYVAGAPVPGTYNMGTRLPVGEVTDTTRAVEAVMGRGYDVPGFPSLFANARTAQAIFDADFVLPSSPRSPNITVIPGDRQNTVTWDASPVDADDPYCLLATDPENALYDPNFVCNDFQGFRVYRKSNPSADFTLIAQFDLADGITEQVTTLTEVETATGDVIVISADTAAVCNVPGCVADTGLKFAIVDRGGSFPNPENGPGLTNGVRYYYAVTSFDINSPFSGPSTLESARVLSETTSAVPRPRASNITAATFDVQLLGSDGAELDPSAPMPAVDPATGTFAGPMPPTNGFEVTLGAFIPEVITSEGSVTIQIDSIVPGNPAVGEPSIYHVTRTGQGITTQLEIPLTIHYTGTSTNRAEASFVVAQAGADFGTRFGVDPTTVSVTGAVQVAAVDPYVASMPGRAHANGVLVAANGPRWFATGGSEPADPNAGMGDWWCFPGIDTDPADAAAGCPQVVGGLRAGSLPGMDIVPIKGYLTTPSRIRSFEPVLSQVRRAADIELTWGANGTIESVVDVTHNVDVPFHPHIRASYGFLTEASFANVAAANTRDKDNAVITASDFTCIPPHNQHQIDLNVEFVNCPDPNGAILQPTAALVPVDTVVYSFSKSGVAPVPGIALYINGELFFIVPEDGQLPAAGTSWTLRTYSGGFTDVTTVGTGSVLDPATDLTDYEFASVTRPSNVPGLRAVVQLTPTTEDAVTEEDVANVHTVPDPYYVTNKLETSTAQKKLLFVNLPTEAIIRVYTLSGVLVAALEHEDPTGGGTLEWDLRSRNNQFLASGVYFYHVEAPNGQEKVGKFTIVQYAQ